MPARRGLVKREREIILVRGSSLCKSPSDQQETSPQTSQKYEMCTEQEFGFSIRSKMGEGGHLQTLMVPFSTSAISGSISLSCRFPRD